MEDFLQAMQEIGVELCVVTDGKKGAYLFHNHQFYHIAARAVPVIGTVGAGDAFSSTLAALWLQGFDIEKAGKMASLNALSVVKQLDAQSGLLDGDTLLNMLNKEC